MKKTPKKVSPTFLEAMIQEADAYVSMEMIESCVESGLSLHNVPVQPLYLAMKALPLEQAASYLPKLSEEQRTIMLDLDLWEKDELDVGEFEHWVRAYALCLDDEVRQIFSRSSEFGLYLKGKFNIWTFDDEAPRYPDHDNYFLTDDHLLLFEFDDHFDCVEDIQRLIRDLYSHLGLEAAYAHLFKYVSEGYLCLLEDEYRFKKGRLVDAGFVDYYDALAIDNAFPDLAVMNSFIEKKVAFTPHIDDFGKGQRLDRAALVAYKKGLEPLYQELAKVGNPKRRDFLQFNFIRLINGTITLRSGLKEGSMALNRVGMRTRSLLELGYSYLEDNQENGVLTLGPEESLFDYFDFCEIYKIGNTLLSFSQKKLKKALNQSKVQKNEGFLGQKLGGFLDLAFDEPVKFENEDGTSSPVADYESWKRFDSLASRFEGILPFVDKMYRVINELMREGTLRDHFYLNYNVDQLDFESVILSSFANFLLGYYQNVDHEVGKLGVTLEEYKHFLELVLEGKPLTIMVELDSKIEEFQESFGLENVPQFLDYFREILKEHLEGYDFNSMNVEEFCHVGGPIIFNTQAFN